MNISSLVHSARGAFVNVFVRYGSGAEHFRPITQTKWWNTVSWILIAVGIVGWALFLFWLS